MPSIFTEIDSTMSNESTAVSSSSSTSKKPKIVRAEKEEPETCSICADRYTSILRKKIVCKFCSKDTCSKCVEQYLLSRHEDAHCLHCRVNYSDQVLQQSCTKTYLRQTYFQHRQAVLINRHRAQLPALQAAALTVRRRRERDGVIQGIRNEIAAAAAARNDILNLYNQQCLVHYSTPHNKDDSEERKAFLAESRKKLDALLTQSDTIAKQIKEKKRLIGEIQWPAREVNQDDAKEDDVKEEDRKKFIRRCTHDNCTGFLSSAWKCAMCEWYSCSKCFAVKGDAHDSPHECTKDDLETAELIRSNCKPCPKCGEQIEHGGGCSQMWCITCQTPWDWNTGKIVTSGPLHNPLYYEWLRRTGGSVPRNPGDVPCGGYPHAWNLIRHPKGMNLDISDKYFEFHRICNEIQDISQRQYRTHMDDTSVNNIHVRFLLQDYDEKYWGKNLAINEKKRKRDSEIQEVFAAFRMVAVELINRVQLYSDKYHRTFTYLSVPLAEQFINELDVEIQELLRMINDALRTISISYSYSVPFISQTPRKSDDQLYYRVIIKNFSDEMKKKRGSKEEHVQDDVQDDAGAQDMHDTPTMADAPTMEDVHDVIDEATTQENRVIEPRIRRHYRYHDSDSDNDLPDDAMLQTAIAASLQVAFATATHL